MTKEACKVALVILNWCRAEDTLAALSSALAGEEAPDAVIVVDNGSNPEDVEALRTGLESTPATLICRAHNGGFSVGVNEGIRWAMAQQMDVIWLLNNDAIAHRNALGAARRVLDELPSVAAVASVSYKDREFTRVQCWGGGRLHPWLGITTHFRKKPRRWSNSHYLSGASLFLRSSALVEVGLFDEQYFLYWEDVDWSHRAVARGWHLQVVDDSKIFHAESSSLGPASRAASSHYLRGARIFWKENLPGHGSGLLLAPFMRQLRNLWRRVQAIQETRL